MKTRVHSYLFLKYVKSLQTRKEKNQAEALNSFSSFWRWSILILLPQVYFSFNNFEGICFKYVLLFSQILLIYLMHCAMIKVCHLYFSWSALFLLTVFTKKKDLWWFICLEEGVTFCSVFAACILVHSSISNDISLFILHFPNLIAMKSYARVLVFSYWICKSNWKNKKQRLEFPLNLAVSKMEETEQGSKWWNIFVKSRVCWNRIWSVFFSNSPSAF